MTRLLRWSALLSLVCALAVACGPPPTPHPVGEGTLGPSGGDYASAIRSEAVWKILAARPATNHVARTEVVKVIVDGADGEIYFLESNKWPIHFYFAAKFLNKPGNRVPDQGAFNVSQYRMVERRFVLGTVSHYLDADRWVFDLFAGDVLPLEATAAAFKKIQSRVFFGQELAYRPVPPAHEANLEKAKALMPIVTTDELFGKIRYQPLELGEAYGYLKVIPKGTRLDPSTLRPFDIVVLGDLPEDIPVVSAVVTDSLQAPLGHINVLCHNRRTPNMALRGGSTSADVLALAGKLVRLVVDAQSYTLEPATQAKAEASWNARRPAKGFRPDRDDHAIGMPLLAELDRGDVARVGAKTAQLAYAARLLPKGVTPRGFALPFHAYATFLKRNALDTRLAAILADPTFRKDPDRRQKDLDAFRATMMKAEVPKETVAALVQRIKTTLPPGKVRLRSSTNAEDLPGFNGAGLYRSTRVNPDDTDDVIRGLREVWSSTWLWAAFEEREYYRIDHRTVGMAILVQESIDDDIGNGVAITANPFSQGNPGYFINVQVSGGSVTGAKGDEIPEQILYYTYDTGKGFERLSRSSLAKGAVVMEDPVVEELQHHLTTLHGAFTGDLFGASGKAIDVEFLVRRSAPRIVIVQARPFEVTWAADRQWRDGDGKLIKP